MTATARDPRIRSEREVRDLARRAERDPASLTWLTREQIRAVALYWWSKNGEEVKL